MSRHTLIQQAQANIRRQLLEGPRAGYFAGIDIVCTDKGDIEASVTEAIAKVGVCIVIDVQGGPAPILGDPTEWTASVTICETPAINRAGGSGKTADAILDEVLLAFADGGFFRPQKVTPLSGNDVLIEIAGTTSIILDNHNHLKGEQS